MLNSTDTNGQQSQNIDMPLISVSYTYYIRKCMDSIKVSHLSINVNRRNKIKSFDSYITCFPSNTPHPNHHYQGR